MMWLLGAILAQAGAATPLDPDRSYGMVVDIASQSKIPFAGTTDVISRSLLRVDVEQTQGGALMATHKVCDVRLISDSRAKTELPVAFIRSLPQLRYPIIFVHHDDHIEFWADPGLTHVGYDPAITGGEVPKRGNQAGVVDVDGDGKPGVTVHLVLPIFGSVRVYVAHKGQNRYRGVVQDGGAVGGVELVALEQRTLGASFAPFAANPQITPVPEASRFALRPIDDGLDCEELVARWDGSHTVP